jgi:lysozyme family protein
MTDFDKSLRFVLKNEGGFVDDPDDPGGATNFGITQRIYDGYRNHLGLLRQTVGKITDDEVKKIYEQQYWINGRAVKLPWPFNLMHFDACVNIGKPEDGFKRSARVLQRALRVKVDGDIGPITLGAAKEATSKSIENYLWYRLGEYVDTVRKNKRLAKFMWIWVVRIKHLREECLP